MRPVQIWVKQTQNLPETNINVSQRVLRGLTLHSLDSDSQETNKCNSCFITISNIIEHFESRPTIYSYFDFGLKNSSFRLLYQRPSSSADCARELLNGSNGSSRLHSKKNFLVGGCGFFVTDVISEVVLGSFWHMLPGLVPNR